MNSQPPWHVCTAFLTAPDLCALDSCSRSFRVIALNLPTWKLVLEREAPQLASDELSAVALRTTRELWTAAWRVRRTAAPSFVGGVRWAVRLLHRTATIDDRTYVFGGSRAGRCWSDLWSFQSSNEDEHPNASVFQTKLIATRIDGAYAPLCGAPPPRAAHAMVALGTKLVVFGGTGPSSSNLYYNDTWIIDTADAALMAWSRLHTAGHLPAPRMGHSASALDGEEAFVVFGGSSPGAVFGDVHVCALGPCAERWREITPTGTAPCPRSGHAACWIGGAAPARPRTRMLVTGGNDLESTFNDVFVLDFARTATGSEARWSTLVLRGAAPPPLIGHTATPIGRWVLVCGGRDKFSDVEGWNNRLFVLDTVAGRWIESSAVVYPVTGHAVVATSRGIALLGGLCRAASAHRYRRACDIEAIEVG